MGETAEGLTRAGAAGPDGPSPPVIELRGVDKWFGDVHANRDVSLVVRPGTIHGIVGAADRRRPASHQDLAAVGAMIAVQDAHQRRLAGAVLAHEAVDRPLANDQRQVAVGVDVAKPLVDAPELDDRRRRLGAHFAM